MATLLTLLVLASAAACLNGGCILYYGDAQAHLNISRSIVDSRTPGYSQLGTVWLPMLHVICLPFVQNGWLWSTGLAGAIPVALCFVIAGTCFYFSAKEAYGSALAASVVLACFALNPNVLYLASIPMTEIVFLAALAVTLLSILRFARRRQIRYLALGIFASWCMSFTRYDGWFLIPFTAAAFSLFARIRRAQVLILFGLLASLAPLYWIAHNWWQTSNPLDFYNGPYSAIAIQGDAGYPGYHDWIHAAGYYAEAGRLCAGTMLSLLALAGVCAALRVFRSLKLWFPLLFLLLTPAFYVWSIHSSKNPIFVPTLWPHGYYNSRYGIALVVFSAFSTGALTAALPMRMRPYALLLPLLSILPWLWRPSPERWICWKESQVNSASRRAWSSAGALFLRENYRPGQTILTNFGDVTTIFCKARIPLRDTLHEGNGPAWLAAESRPDLYHPASWVVVQAGKRTAQKIADSPSYKLVREIATKGAPTLEIYQRTP